MLHFCNIQFTLSLIVDLFYITSTSAVCYTAVPLHCWLCRGVVSPYTAVCWCGVVGSYWAGAGHEVAGPPGCTAALLWAAPPTPHNILAITLRLSASSLAPVYIKIFYPLTILKPTSLSSYHVNIFVNIFACALQFLPAIPAV